MGIVWRGGGVVYFLWGWTSRSARPPRRGGIGGRRIGAIGAFPLIALAESRQVGKEKPEARKRPAPGKGRTRQEINRQVAVAGSPFLEHRPHERLRHIQAHS